MPFAHIGELRMHYQTRGKGPPLILIMGLSGDLTWWDRMVPHLEDDFSLVLLDNRGAGQTDKPTGRYSIPLFASDTIALMDSLGIERAGVFGVSMGGMIAQEMALRYPRRVQGIVLGCTHGGGRGFVTPSAETIQNMTLTRGKSLEEIARQMVSVLFSPEFREREPERMQAVVDRYVRNPPQREAFRNQFWAVLAHDCHDRLPDIRLPTLILTGDEDILVPPENSRVLESRIPGSRLVALRGAGHAFFVERPEETARHVRAHFLDGIVASYEPAGDGVRPTA